MASQATGDVTSPQPRRPTTGQSSRVPSYAQPRHLNRRQTPILEQVRKFVEEFGSKDGEPGGRDDLSRASYYTGQLMTAASMAHGMPGSGDATRSMVRRQREQAQILANLSTKGSKRAGDGQGGVAKNVRQLRERMHRATQGLPTTPLPSKLLAAFGARDPSVEPDGVEDNALSWLGLRKMKKCGLCDVSFPVVTLVTSVSVKALVHLRKDWADRRTSTAPPLAASPSDDGSDQGSPRAHSPSSGVRAAAESKSRVPAHAYNETKVCRYCAQFFGVFLGERFEECAPAPIGRVNRRALPGLAQRAVSPTKGPSSSSSSSSVDSQDGSSSDDGDDSHNENKSSIASTVTSRSSSADSRSSVRSDRVHHGATAARHAPPPSQPHLVPRPVQIKALEAPARKVVGTRSSLLRRTHHHYVKQEIEEMEREDSRDVAVVQKRSTAALKEMELARKRKPVCQEFVLGPTSSDEAEGTSNSRRAAPQTSVQSAADVMPHRTDTPANITAESSTFSPLAARADDEGEGFQSELTPLDGTAASALPSNSEAAASAVVVGRDLWAGGRVCVLILCCQAYPDRLAMPAAAPHIATRVAHWCSQVFYQHDAPIPDAAPVVSSGTQEVSTVQVLFNDDVTPRSVGHFLQECAAVRASPLMIFLGCVEHAEERFGDAVLQATVASGGALSAIGPHAWPEQCRQWLSMKQTTQAHHGGSKHHSQHQHQRKQPHAHMATRIPPHDVNPLSAPSFAHATPVCSSGISILEIDAVCGGLRLPRPTLVVDCCFGPLVLATKSLLVVHPTRPPPATVVAGPRGVSSSAVACGQVLDAFSSLVETSIRHKSRRIPNCTWAHITSRLFQDAEVGVAAQEIFHYHIHEDAEQRPYVVTSPAAVSGRLGNGDTSSSYAVPWSNIKFEDPPMLLQLPTLLSSDGNKRSDQEPIWFPVASTLVELHLNPTQSSQQSSLHSTWTSSMNDDILDSTAARISQTFCLRLHPRSHSTQRMASSASQVRLANALRNVLQTDATTHSLEHINFNISVVLSGHVAVFLSSDNQLSVQQAAAVVMRNIPLLKDAGCNIVDSGFVVARSSDAPLSLAAITSSHPSLPLVVVLDVHVA